MWMGMWCSVNCYQDTGALYELPEQTVESEDLNEHPH